MTLEASAESHDDAAALLRGERGPATNVELDLRFQTTGDPYAYRLTTRYEIPCRVAGTIRVGDEEPLEFAGAIGQRDHSWGTRDWWSMDWMWSAGGLDDGTRLHAVQLRLPDGPRLAVGYLQPPGGELVELSNVRAEETVADSGLVSSARISLGEPQPELVLDVEPLAFGPLLLVAPDGRVSRFPRAMCRLRAEDGREGLGWVEWNMSQPARA